MSKEFTNLKFIPLPSLIPEQYLTGYFIEGIWGNKTNSVNIKNIQELFASHNLDQIIAIVPVTYYLPLKKWEASGMNLSVIKDQITFSATYAVLVYSKNSENLYKKSYSSIKQVFAKTIGHPKQLDFNKHSETLYLKVFYDLFDNQFIPYITNQIINFLKNKNKYKIFPKPAFPLYYLLPH